MTIEGIQADIVQTEQLLNSATDEDEKDMYRIGLETNKSLLDINQSGKIQAQKLVDEAVAVLEETKVGQLAKLLKEAEEKVEYKKQHSEEVNHWNELKSKVLDLCDLEVRIRFRNFNLVTGACQIVSILDQDMRVME